MITILSFILVFGVVVFLHELGHFLLSHTIENIISSKETLIALRAKEISVDRIGLWACRDIKIAIRTIIKTLSGLPENSIDEF